MSDLVGEITPEFAPLQCNTIVHRALIKRDWINEDTLQVRPNAFFLRQDKGEIGVSVNIAAVCSPQDCVSRFRKCRAVASLHVGHVRDLGLDIIQDKYNHANIIGLPYREDNLAEAQRLGGLLAKQSRIIQV
jgi:hypothetical protein